jgi:cobalamin biosynthesis protein CobD/CbiB
MVLDVATGNSSGAALIGLMLLRLVASLAVAVRVKNATKERVATLILSAKVTSSFAVIALNMLVKHVERPVQADPQMNVIMARVAMPL